MLRGKLVVGSGEDDGDGGLGFEQSFDAEAIAQADVAKQQIDGR